MEVKVFFDKNKIDKWDILSLKKYIFYSHFLNNILYKYLYTETHAVYI